MLEMSHVTQQNTMEWMFSAGSLNRKKMLTFPTLMNKAGHTCCHSHSVIKWRCLCWRHRGRMKKRQWCLYSGRVLCSIYPYLQRDLQKTRKQVNIFFLIHEFIYINQFNLKVQFTCYMCTIFMYVISDQFLLEKI